MYRVHEPEDSAERISKLIHDQPKNQTLILVGHNGPTGLGDRRQSICGRDFVRGKQGAKSRACPSWQTSSIQYALLQILRSIVLPYIEAQLIRTFKFEKERSTAWPKTFCAGSGYYAESSIWVSVRVSPRMMANWSESSKYSVLLLSCYLAQYLASNHQIEPSEEILNR